MRLLVATVVALAGAALIGVVVVAQGSDRSACGEVGDRERVASTDGMREAFVRCTSEGSAWLYVADGTSARRLVPASYGCCYRPSSRVIFRAPVWSPGGHRLAVVIEDVGGVDVWVIDVRGRAARRVTTGPARERAPRWSADGRRIEFRTETGALVTASATPR
jgi:Tol biopolymer transport system component